MIHQAYDKNEPLSGFYKQLIPMLQKIKIKSLMRIKVNLYPNTQVVTENLMHADYEFPNTAAILSLNTCDGYTKLEDGTKIDSVANRLLIFDGGEKHCSTTPSNVPARFNINMNYYK